MARQVDIVLTLNAAGVVTGGKAGKAAVEGLGRQAKKTEDALAGMGRQGKKAGDQIGRTMRSGRAGALSLNRIVQDLPFGFIAIQNNVTELAASFTVMKQNGLSSGEAIKSIISQFKGPGGFLFIISAAVALITAFGGKIVEAFNKGKTTAKELTEALETLLTIQRELNKFEISAEDIEAKLLRTRELIANATQKTQKFTVLLAGATVSVTDAEREALKINLDRLNGLKALEKQLEKELETSKALAIEQEVLAAVGADLVVEEEKVTKSKKTHTAAIKEEITQLEKLQVELVGLRALSISEAVAIQTAIRDLERQIITRRSLVDLLAEQAEAQALLARAGVEVEPLEPRGLDKPLEPPTELVGTEGIDAQIEATERLIEIQRRRQEAAEAVRDAEIATAESAVLSAAAAVEAGDNVLQATLGVVRDIITARLAQSIAGAVAWSSIFGPIAGAAAGALMAALFNQLMPSDHKSSSGGAGAGARADTTSSQAVGLGGIRVQNRGLTTGATGAAASARAQTVTIRVIEPNLFRLNTELSNADGIRDQVGSI